MHIITQEKRHYNNDNFRSYTVHVCSCGWERNAMNHYDSIAALEHKEQNIDILLDRIRDLERRLENHEDLHWENNNWER